MAAFGDWQRVPSPEPDDIDITVDTVNTALFKFADDTKGIRRIDSPSDCAKLQDDLDNLSKWATQWQMLFNVDKCHILHLGRHNPLHQYSMNGVPLKVVEVEKDLGVLIHNSGSPSTQVAAVAKKANAILGQILRAFTYRDKVTFRGLFIQYVHPHLEYAVQAWSPWLQNDIDILENVQRRAVRSISGLHGTYEEKLAQLELPSLASRRNRGDMIQTFKTIKQIDNVDPSTLFTLSSSHHHHATRNSAVILDNSVVPSTNLFKPAARLELRRNFFSNRVITPWNNLPPMSSPPRRSTNSKPDTMPTGESFNK